MQVKRISALTKDGVPELWETMDKYHSIMLDSNELHRKRQLQKRIWMWSFIQNNIMDMFKSHSAVQSLIEGVENDVMEGEITPGTGADLLLSEFIKS